MRLAACIFLLGIVGGVGAVGPPQAAAVDAQLEKQCGAQISACTADSVCRECVANNNPQVKAAYLNALIVASFS
jgi:hypothetical protein